MGMPVSSAIVTPFTFTARLDSFKRLPPHVGQAVAD